jgi:hypothetical protein
MYDACMVPFGAAPSCYVRTLAKGFHFFFLVEDDLCASHESLAATENIKYMQLTLPTYPACRAPCLLTTAHGTHWGNISSYMFRKDVQLLIGIILGPVWIT